MTCAGACATTQPRVSKPRRPARPAICMKSRTVSRAVFWPSYLQSLEKSTVRIGTLIPTPSVSVPQTTCSSPACASRSTSLRYRGSIPAWCTPTPERRIRLSSGPNTLSKRVPEISRAMASRCGRSATDRLTRSCASSLASRWEKCTTYTGPRPCCSSSRSASCIGRSEYSYCSGTGRSSELTTVSSRPERAGIFCSNADVSPRVADMSSSWVCGMHSRGSCQARPREGSEKKWNSSITTCSTDACAPSHMAMFARISAVAHVMGAPRLMETSPVIIATFSAPKISQSSKNFSETSALMGEV